MNGSPHHLVFCVEDTVGLKDDRTCVGVVDRSFGDVDSHEPRPQRNYGEDIEKHGDVPSEEFEKFMKSGIPPRGTVLVSWQTALKTELIPEARLELLDRALYVGDVVKRNAKHPMSGTVIGSQAICTLFPAASFNSGQITQAVIEEFSIRNVPADELINAHELVEGALVVYNDWVGRIGNVLDEVSIKLSNNSVVVVDDPDDLEMDDAMIERINVGHTVRTKKGNLRRGRWKYGAFDPNVRPEGMVVEARTVCIEVHWLSRRIGGSAIGSSSQEPNPRLVTDELESRNFYVYDASRGAAATLPVAGNGSDRSYHVAEVAVGDRVRFKDLTGAAVKYDGSNSQGKLFRIPRTETLGYDMNVFLVLQTQTKVTVQWQDLTITEDMSTALIPDPNVEDDDEVWPGELVCTKEQREKKETDVSWTSQPAKVGIVQAVKSRDRIATVRWFENPTISFLAGDLIPPSRTGDLLETSEDVSLYDIQTTPSLTRRRGDFVMIHPESIQVPLNIAGPNWFGEVIDLGSDGRLTVRLGAAKPVVDILVPYERVTLTYSSDTNDQLFSMEDTEEEYDSEEDEYDSDTDSQSFREMWIEYVGMDGDIGNEEDWSTEDDVSMPDLELPSDEEIDTSKTTPELPSNANRKPESVVATPVPRSHAASLTPTADDTSTSIQIPSNTSPEVLVPFSILDSPPPSDHRYLHQTGELSATFMRKIAKEHKILRSSLPPNIFVRTWESRLDLIRVLIIGPTDTPYEYAPFVIDFHLGSTWPSTAPEAHFHSWTNGDGPVNPNLYEDGKICLSLLGTWHSDERGESWTSGKSTLLQVLVSIMGLVLVKEPYYNEAGYDVHRDAPEKKLSSALYTERAYFRARAFIIHALTNDVVPFKEELQYLYRNTSANAPRLLDKAIEAAKDIVDRSSSGTEEEERDGLRTISLGAIVMLRREVEKLEALSYQT